jgi:hypothetical protein
LIGRPDTVFHFTQHTEESFGIVCAVRFYVAQSTIGIAGDAVNKP